MFVDDVHSDVHTTMELRSLVLAMVYRFSSCGIPSPTGIPWSIFWLLSKTFLYGLLINFVR